jgi:hypothetical protein
MQRAFTWALTTVLLLGVLAVSTALACTADSEGLELIDGELPGGG